MRTTLEIVCPLVVCGGFVSGFIRTFFTPDTEQPFDEVDARMAAAIAAEDHAGRRAALILARHGHREGQ